MVHVCHYHSTLLTGLFIFHPEFSDILRCLIQCLRRLGSKRIWEGESPEYPQVVFDSIKDNPSYSNMLLTFDPTKAKPWFLLFMLEYLGQVWETPVFGEVLAKFTAFACDELQHERFGDNRSVAMTALAQVCIFSRHRIHSTDNLYRLYLQHCRSLRNPRRQHTSKASEMCFAYIPTYWWLLGLPLNTINHSGRKLARMC